MKLQTLSAALVAPLLITGSLVVNGSSLAEDDSDVRALIDLQAREIAELRMQVTENKDLMEMTLKYLDVQASAAKSLESTLSEAEKLGFTAGINSHSREALLRGWRSYLSNQQSGVPRTKAAPPAAKTPGK